MLEGLKHLFHAAHATLADVSDPTAVKLYARVASPNAVRSPFSGMVAAVFHVDFFVGSVLIGEDLVVEAGGLGILLPAQRFRLEFEGAAGDGVTLDRPLPPGCEHIAASLSRPGGALHYRELSLSHGEVVELLATVEKVRPDLRRSGQSVHAGGYRDEHVDDEAPFVARPDLAEVVVRSKMPSFR
jgi:hypothetical protein